MALVWKSSMFLKNQCLACFEIQQTADPGNFPPGLTPPKRGLNLWARIKAPQGTPKKETKAKPNRKTTSRPREKNVMRSNCELPRASETS